MTERKPPGASWESWIESQIGVALEQGAFDKLPDEATNCRRLIAVNGEIGRLNATAMEGPATQLGKLDVEWIIERWRQPCAANSR